MTKKTVVRRRISRRKWVSYSRFKITRRRRTANRHMGVSECQWHSSCEPTEPTGEKATFGLSEAVPQGIYINLLTSGKRNTYLADIDRQAQERFERLIEDMKQTQGMTNFRFIIALSNILTNIPIV